MLLGTAHIIRLRWPSTKTGSYGQTGANAGITGIDGTSLPSGKSEYLVPWSLRMMLTFGLRILSSMPIEIRYRGATRVCPAFL